MKVERYSNFDRMTSNNKKIDYLKTLSKYELEQFINAGIRHHSGVQPSDYLENWLRITRLFAFATHDDSWGELEKELGIILTNYVWGKLH